MVCSRKGGSHGFVVGHVAPEAQSGGPIALVENGDTISIDAPTQTITLEVEDSVLEARRKAWKAPPLQYTRGALAKFAHTVTCASEGAVTDKFDE